jgi:hypothetical protein
VSRRWCILPALAGLGLLAAACAAEPPATLFVNLFPIGERDPFAELERIEATAEPGGHVFALAGSAARDTFGSLPAGGPCRLALRGLAAGRLRSWGFSPPLLLGGGARKTTVFFSRDDLAVAHAGPELVAPDQGLAPLGLPRSIIADGLRVEAAHNASHLYLEIAVADEVLVANETWDSGDRVVVALDGRSQTDPQQAARDDLVLVFGSAKYVEIWNPHAAPPPAPQIVRDFEPAPAGDGYRVYTAIPLTHLLPAPENDGPGPSRTIGLGLELHDDDGTGAPRVVRWPPDWQPVAGGAHDYALAPPDDGSGGLALKTRVLDARRVADNAVDFEPGLGAALRGSGAVDLARAPLAGEDGVRLFAAWDSQGLLLAAASDDAVACAQQRQPGDRTGLLRDDAVEIAVAPAPDRVYRTLINLTGASASDRDGGADWQPEIYFRFDVDGPLPEDDCRRIHGWTFKARLRWSDLGYVGQPPAEGTRLAFDVAVHDNDRGAHSSRAFSPMGPAIDPERMAELRLFAY